MQKTLKWSAAQPIKKPDNIISSKARETGDYGFKPSYNSEPKEDMRHIMSMEYMRIWFKERGKYEKDTYSREQIIKEESKIKRRFVQRMMTYKKPDKNYFLEEKIEKHLKEKQNKDEPIDYRKYKYKPICPKPKEKSSKKLGELKIEGQKKAVEKTKNEERKKKEDKQAIIICCRNHPNCYCDESR